MLKTKTNNVFLEFLPTWKEGIYIGKTNWKESIGHRVRFIYKHIKGEVEIVGYKSKGQVLSIKYKDQKIFEISTGNFQNCKLGNLLGTKSKEFKIEIDAELKDDKRNVTIIEREYRIDKKGQNYKYYKYRCNKCGYDDGWIIEGNLLKGQGCSCTHIVYSAQWMIPYFQGGYDEAKLYTISSNIKIYPICPDCGRIKNKAVRIYDIYRYKSIGCTCGDGQSYPFKFMYSVLEQLNLDFETEYSPKWISPKRYDFYFNKNNIKYIIETDGEFHNRDNLMNGQTVEESNKIDNYKDDKAREHNIEPIRIECYKSELEYIKDKIIHSRLNELFNLNIIDWNKAGVFALSNLVKVACDLKFNNPQLTTSDIIRLTKFSKTTVLRYLNKGTKIGWCYYNGKEEKQISIEKRKKPIEMFKDVVSMGVFTSVVDLERHAEEKFGVKLMVGGIYKACKKVKSTYKGYTFKYIETSK